MQLEIAKKGNGAAMGNKKVLMIPPVSVFSRYVRARDGMLRIAVYTERSFPLEFFQKRFANILRLMINWSLVGVYTDDYNSGKNKNDFRKLLKLCENRKVDMVMCGSREDLPEKTKLLNEIGIPVYVLEESRIIDHETTGNTSVEFLHNYA